MRYLIIVFLCFSSFSYGGGFPPTDGGRRTCLGSFTPDSSWNEAHHIAHTGQNIEALENLSLDALNARDEKGYAPIHVAAITADRAEVLQKLIDLGVNKDVRSSGQDTPLHLAAENGRLEAVDILLRAGAIINGKNSDILSAAHLAVLGKHVKVLERLREARANFDTIIRDQGITPAYSAALGGDIEVIEVLYRGGADFTAIVRGGDTPFHKIAREDIKILKKLIELGADVNAKNGDGKTLVHMAVERRNIKLLKELIKLKADLNKKDDKRRTPAYIAFQNQDEEILEILREQDVPINIHLFKLRNFFNL